MLSKFILCFLGVILLVTACQNAVPAPQKEFELLYEWADDPAGLRGRFTIDVKNGVGKITVVRDSSTQTMTKQILDEKINRFVNVLEVIGYFNSTFPAKKEVFAGVKLPLATHKTRNHFFIRTDRRERTLLYFLPSPDVEESDERKIRQLIVEIEELVDFHPSPEVRQARPSYPTKEACENTEKCQCGFVMCDYIPKGKTYEEVCGKDFEKGWQCV